MNRNSDRGKGKKGGGAKHVGREELPHVLKLEHLRKKELNVSEKGFKGFPGILAPPSIGSPCFI